MRNKIIKVCEITPKNITTWECAEWVMDGYENVKQIYGRYSLTKYFGQLATYNEEWGAQIKKISCVENKPEGVKGLSVSHVIIDEFVMAGETKE